MYTGGKDITFPIPFTSIPAVYVGGDNMLYGAIGADAGRTSETTFHVDVGHNAANMSIKFHWIAIGR